MQWLDVSGRPHNMSTLNRFSLVLSEMCEMTRDIRCWWLFVFSTSRKKKNGRYVNAPTTAVQLNGTARSKGRQRVTSKQYDYWHIAINWRKVPSQYSYANKHILKSLLQADTNQQDDLLRSDDSIARGSSLHRLFLGTKLRYDLHLSFYE